MKSLEMVTPLLCNCDCLMRNSHCFLRGSQP